MNQYGKLQDRGCFNNGLKSVSITREAGENKLPFGIMDVAALKQRSPEQLRLVTSIFFFISGFGYSTWASRIPSIQQHLHLNEAELGAVLFAMPIGLILTLPVTGKLLGRFESRVI